MAASECKMMIWPGVAAMPARDDALTFGPADLMVIKRTRGAWGHRLLVIGVVQAERMKCE